MIDTIATAGGFIFVAYVMGQVAKGNIERRKHREAALDEDAIRNRGRATSSQQIERLDAEMRLLMRERGALVHSNVVDMAAWRNSKAQGVGTLRG
jgi:hypothetical protein